eukprot:2481363-Heterocapsa_arctica.AAC.1
MQSPLTLPEGDLPHPCRARQMGTELSNSATGRTKSFSLRSYYAGRGNSTLVLTLSPRQDVDHGRGCLS